MLHLLPRVAHVSHLLQLLARLPVLGQSPQLPSSHHCLQFVARPRFLEDPVVLLKVDLVEDIFEALLGKDTGAFLFEDGILLAGAMRVDGVEDGVDTVEDIPLDRDAAVGHDLLHLLSSHVEVLVQVIHCFPHDCPDYTPKYIALFIGVGSALTAFSTSA